MTFIQPENAWFNEIKPSDDEEVLISYPANHSQGKRAVGGKLFVTNRRIAFAPNRLDTNLGGDFWEMPIIDFDSAGTVKPTIRITEIFSGALRTRLVIYASNDGIDYFVVDNPELAASEIYAVIYEQAEQGGDTKMDSRV